MASTMTVTEITRIGPYSDSSNPLTEFTLPLTFFDAFWFKFLPVERLFFYKLTELTRPHFDSVVLPKLKQSLSIALHHFLPLAGNLKWDPQSPKPVILYTPNDTVSVTVAESNADFTYLSGNGRRVATELHPFVPELPVSTHQASIMSLKITLLTGQGFCIGVSTHHGILDGQTLATFLKAWAYISKHDIDGATMSILPENLAPFLDRSKIDNPNGLDLKFINWWQCFAQKISGSDSDERSLECIPDLGVDMNDLVRETFVLTRLDLKKLREKAEELQNDVVGSKKLHLSTFVLMYAYVATCMVKAKGGDGNKAVGFGFTADYRSRLDPPLPSNYFGNCVVPAISMGKVGTFTEEKESFHGFVSAVEKLSELVLGLDSKIHDRFINVLTAYTTIEVGARVVSIAGSNRLGIYESDFGWGKPSKVEVVSIDKTGAFSLAESCDGSGGVELGLSLCNREMMDFASIIVNGLNSL